MTVHIAYCVDKNYRQHFGVSLTSLLCNRMPADLGLCVHLIVDLLDQDFEQRLRHLEYVYRIDIRTYVLDQTPMSGTVEQLGGYLYVSRLSWARMMLADILPDTIDRVLYLDADTVVLSDLTNLYNTDLNANPIAAVLDSSNTAYANHYQTKQYFNAGVLLQDLTLWRQRRYVEQCVDFALENKQRLLFGEQCCLNLVFAGKFKKLPSRYNRFVTPSVTIEDLSEIALLHFITPDKPWYEWYEAQLGQLYWDYLARSPWAGAKPVAPRNMCEMLRLIRSRLARKGDTQNVTTCELMLTSMSYTGSFHPESLND